jgi:hypothetical protein
MKVVMMLTVLTVALALGAGVAGLVMLARWL